LRGGGHLAAGVAATALGEFGAAQDHAEQAKALLRGTTAQTQLAWSVGLAAMYRMPSDAPRARLESEEARGLATATRAAFLIGFVAAMAAYGRLFAQLPAEGLPFAEEALRIGRRLDAEWLTGFALSVLGELTQLGGDLQAARGYLEQALPLHTMMQNRFEVAMSLIALASCEAASGEASALGTWQTALAVSADLGNRIEIVTAVLGIAEQFAVRAHVAAAARLLGAVEEDIGEVYPTQFQRRVQAAREQALALVRAALSPEAFAQAWAAGQALSLDEATDLALAELATSLPLTNAATTGGA
jgi:tetratricopeptide (TPR) repeat protein